MEASMGAANMGKGKARGGMRRWWERDEERCVCVCAEVRGKKE